LFYTINDCWKAGVRAEWWKSDGASYQEVTAGINYKPHANVIIRPEYRYNFGNAPLTSANGNTIPNDVSVFGIDAIITY
jgi:opacity protein-like surface antigen